jgi:hypothetical protein
MQKHIKILFVLAIISLIFSGFAVVNSFRSRGRLALKPQTSLAQSPCQALYRKYLTARSDHGDRSEEAADAWIVYMDCYIDWLFY